MSKHMEERNALMYQMRRDGNKTLEEVGRMFGVTRERVRQIEAKYAELERLGRYPQALDNTIDKTAGQE